MNRLFDVLSFLLLLFSFGSAKIIRGAGSSTSPGLVENDKELLQLLEEGQAVFRVDGITSVNSTHATCHAIKFKPHIQPLRCKAEGLFIKKEGVTNPGMPEYFFDGLTTTLETEGVPVTGSMSITFWVNPQHTPSVGVTPVLSLEVSPLNMLIRGAFGAAAIFDADLRRALLSATNSDITPLTFTLPFVKGDYSYTNPPTILVPRYKWSMVAISCVRRGPNYRQRFTEWTAMCSFFLDGRLVSSMGEPRSATPANHPASISLLIPNSFPGGLAHFTVFNGDLSSPEGRLRLARQYQIESKFMRPPGKENPGSEPRVRIVNLDAESHQ